MKYLNLNNREMKELLHIRSDTFIVHAVTLSIISGSFYFLLPLIMKEYMSIFFVLFFAIVYMGYVLYTNRKFLKEIIYKQKKVYRGVLSFKVFSPKSKKGKYILSVDGRMFYVNKKYFEYIQEGDTEEFHVSSSTKYLFRVEKVERGI